MSPAGVALQPALGESYQTHSEPGPPQPAARAVSMVGPESPSAQLGDQKSDRCWQGKLATGVVSWCLGKGELEKTLSGRCVEDIQI